MSLKDFEMGEALKGGSDWKIQDLAKFLYEKKARQVYIVENSNIVGVVGITDIVYQAVAKGKLDLEAKDVMTSPVIFAESHISPKEAYFKMVNNNLMLIPVIENGEILGELSLSSAFEGIKNEKNT